MTFGQSCSGYSTSERGWLTHTVSDNAMSRRLPVLKRLSMNTPPRAKIPTILRNQTCPFCGTDLADSDFTKDHLIGRRFVPKGKLQRSWNLILRACERCNNIKSDLEDDLSAITMQPDPSARFRRDDETLLREARRKAAKSVSRRTGKRVAESSETFQIRGSVIPGLNVEFKFIAPPQLDEARVHQLSCFQLAGLFYWITFNQEASRGYFWPGDFKPLQFSLRGDWGNDLARAFMRQVASWQHRVLVTAAGGYFKAAIKRHPDNAVCWSWALEWNDNVRSIGFFGLPEALEPTMKALPALAKVELKSSDGSSLKYREETPLAAADDYLFA